MTKHRVTRRLLAVALSVLLVLGCVAPAVAATYESGTYTGTGTGRNGSVALTLTLTNGRDRERGQCDPFGNCPLLGKGQGAS